MENILEHPEFTLPDSELYPVKVDEIMYWFHILTHNTTINIARITKYSQQDVIRVIGDYLSRTQNGIKR